MGFSLNNIYPSFISLFCQSSVNIIDDIYYFSEYELVHWDEGFSLNNIYPSFISGARCSSVVRRSLMVRWVVGSILHGVDPLSYFTFQPVLHDWCNKGRGICNPVCGMVHIKEPLLLIGKTSPCGGSGFPLSLSVW